MISISLNIIPGGQLWYSATRVRRKGGGREETGELRRRDLYYKAQAKLELAKGMRMGQVPRRHLHRFETIPMPPPQKLQYCNVQRRRPYTMG